MKKLVAVLLTALCGLVYAQSGVSPNLINSTNLTGTVATTSTGGGFSGGGTPGYNASTNTIMFGYTQSQVAYTYAFSQALQNSGMTITGYNYSWDYINQNPYNGNPANGNLSATVNFAGTNNTSLYSRSWTLGPTTDWTNVSGTDTFTNSLLAANIANFSLKFSGKDSRFWAGYYGPQVRNPSLSLNYTFDACSSNPLSSPSCPGYAAAYLTQQCTANPLYDPSCPGYTQALLTQQCNADQLSNPQCPGYANAYLTYQCTQNPLYSTTCAGYEQAYFNQQCSANPLYNSGCPGYSQAYLTQQCNANPLYSATCTGYAAAYKSQQCAISPLYATDCPGYGTAYLNQQCTVNPLYSTQCTGYAQAYFNQQCSLNGLYDQRCPNYSEAYAKKMVLEQQNLASTVATAGVVASTAPQTTTATVDTSSGTVSTTPSTTGSAVVDKALPPPATTANTAAAPAAPVQLVPPPPAANSPTAPQQQAQQEKKPEGGQPPPQGQAQGPNGEKPQPSARQEIQAKRMEAARKDAVEKGKNLANEMGKASDMEAQKQVQNVVIQAMGFTPGFDTYNKAMIPDVAGYKPFTVYNNQKNVDNRRLGMGLYGPSDRLHNELVDSQYRGE